MYMPAWRKEKWKDKGVLGKLQASSLALCLKPPVSENFPLSKTTHFQYFPGSKKFIMKMTMAKFICISGHWPIIHNIF